MRLQWKGQGSRIESREPIVENRESIVRYRSARSDPLNQGWPSQSPNRLPHPLRCAARAYGIFFKEEDSGSGGYENGAQPRLWRGLRVAPRVLREGRLMSMRRRHASAVLPSPPTALPLEEGSQSPRSRRRAAFCRPHPSVRAILRLGVSRIMATPESRAGSFEPARRLFAQVVAQLAPY